MNTQQALELPRSALSNTVLINARCTLRTEEDQRVIVAGGLPVYHFCAADAVAEAYAMVMWVESGFAQPTEVARAFGKAYTFFARAQSRRGSNAVVACNRMTVRYQINLGTTFANHFSARGEQVTALQSNLRLKNLQT